MIIIPGGTPPRRPDQYHRRTRAAGVPGQRTTVSHVPAVAWLPSDIGLNSANFDISAAGSSGGGLTAGDMYLAKLHIRGSIPLGTLWFGNAASNSGTGTTFAGVYDQGANLLSTSADVHTQFSLSPNPAQCPLLTPLNPNTWVWAALLSNMSAVQAQPRTSGAPAAALNFNLPQSQWEFGVIHGLALATLPASFIIANMLQSVAFSIWVGGSP